MRVFSRFLLGISLSLNFFFIFKQPQQFGLVLPDASITITTRSTSTTAATPWADSTPSEKTRGLTNSKTTPTATTTGIIPTAQKTLQPVTWGDDPEVPPPSEQRPKLIMAGAQKGGTSAMQALLNQLPTFKKPRKTWPGTREPHFFNRYVPMFETWEGVPDDEWQAFQKNRTGKAMTPTIVQALRTKYAGYWNPNDLIGDVIPMEKTPDYMFQIDYVPFLIRRVTPWVKILFIIRDPVSRAFSHWKMYHDIKRKGVGKEYYPNSFEWMIQAEVEELRRQGLSKAPSFEEFNQPGFVPNLEAFRPPHNIATRRRMGGNHNVYNMLYRGMYAELLDAWTDYFEMGKSILVVSNEQLSLDGQAVLRDVQQFAGADVYELEEDKLTTNYHRSGSTEVISDEAKRYLEYFYRPYNDELEAFLGKEWYSHYTAGKWNYPKGEIAEE
jgi:Sulfotransferase domain